MLDGEVNLTEEISLSTRSGVEKTFTTAVSHCEEFGFFTGDRVLTPRGPAWVVGVNGGDIYFAIDNDRGCSKWIGCKKADFSSRGFKVIHSVRSQIPTTVLPLHHAPLLRYMVNQKQFSDVAFILHNFNDLNENLSVAHHLPCSLSTSTTPTTLDDANYSTGDNNPSDTDTNINNRIGEFGSTKLAFQPEVHDCDGNQSSVIYACRGILVARSEYFRSLFSNGMFESTLRRGNAGIDLPVVPMHNISPQIFLILMDYLYTGCFETSTLNYATVLNVLNAADLLVITELRELCAKYLIDLVNPENVLNILILSDEYLLINLRDRCFLLLSELLPSDSNIRNSFQVAVTRRPHLAILLIDFIQTREKQHNQLTPAIVAPFGPPTAAAPPMILPLFPLQQFVPFPALPILQVPQAPVPPPNTALVVLPPSLLPVATFTPTAPPLLDPSLSIATSTPTDQRQQTTGLQQLQMSVTAGIIPSDSSSIASSPVLVPIHPSVHGTSFTLTQPSHTPMLRGIVNHGDLELVSTSNYHNMHPPSISSNTDTSSSIMTRSRSIPLSGVVSSPVTGLTITQSRNRGDSNDGDEKDELTPRPTKRSCSVRAVRQNGSFPATTARIPASAIRNLIVTDGIESSSTESASKSTSSPQP